MSLLTENVGSEPENTHLTKILEQKINENEDTLLIEFEPIQPIQESIKQSSIDDVTTSDNLMETLKADTKNKGNNISILNVYLVVCWFAESCSYLRSHDCIM